MLEFSVTDVVGIVTTIATSVATVVTVASLVQSKKQFLLNIKLKQQAK